jgi:hypothetical protein
MCRRVDGKSGRLRTGRSSRTNSSNSTSSNSLRPSSGLEDDRDRDSLSVKAARMSINPIRNPSRMIAATFVPLLKEVPNKEPITRDRTRSTAKMTMGGLNLSLASYCLILLYPTRSCFFCCRTCWISSLVTALYSNMLILRANLARNLLMAGRCSQYSLSAACRSWGISPCSAERLRNGSRRVGDMAVLSPTGLALPLSCCGRPGHRCRDADRLLRVS